MLAMASVGGGGGDGDDDASDNDDNEDDSSWGVQSSLLERIFNYLLTTRGETILSLRRESLG